MLHAMLANGYKQNNITEASNLVCIKLDLALTKCTKIGVDNNINPKDGFSKSAPPLKVQKIANALAMQKTIRGFIVTSDVI